MRRQKRDSQERAYQRGYLAGVGGRSEDSCPHEQPQIRQQWLGGWRDGRTDNLDGLTGVSGLHRSHIS